MFVIGDKVKVSWSDGTKTAGYIHARNDGHYEEGKLANFEIALDDSKYWGETVWVNGRQLKYIPDPEWYDEPEELSQLDEDWINHAQDMKL